jgi:hypothetical protein
MRYTYLFGKMGCCKYRYAIQDSMEVEGAPIQLSAPSNFQATPASQTQINLSWTQQTTCRYYELDSAHTSGGTWATLSSTIDKRATSYNVTGLTNNTTHYFRLRKLGNNTDSLHSSYATANATTSSLSTLSTPTINTPTIVSSTEIDLALASNISNNSGYDWTISRNGGSSFTTLAHTTTNTTTYNFTTGHADSTYQFKARTTGNLVTYNHSAYSAAVSGTTSGGAPTLSSAATNTTGDTVRMLFSKAMEASPSSTGLSTSPSKTINSITRHATNTSRYDIALSSAFVSTDNITCSYSPGTIQSSDGGALGSVSNHAVTNNVSSEQYVAWNQSPHNTTYDAGNHRVTSTSGASGSWTDTGDQGTTVFNGTGIIKYTVDIWDGSNRRFTIGLDHTDPSGNVDNLDFSWAFYPDNGTASAYEAGGKSTPQSVSINDVFEIRIEAGLVIKYYKNNVLIYTSLTTPTLNLRPTCTMRYTATQINNVQISGNIQ